MRCVSVVLLLIGGVAGAGVGEEPPFAAAFAKLKAENDRRMKELSQAFDKTSAAAKTEDERRRLQAQLIADNFRGGEALAARAVALVRPHAADPAAVEVLTWVLVQHAGTDAANDAADLLINHHLLDPRTQQMAERFV